MNLSPFHMKLSTCKSMLGSDKWGNCGPRILIETMALPMLPRQLYDNTFELKMKRNNCLTNYLVPITTNIGSTFE
jgi:hypothetical protein